MQPSVGLASLVPMQFAGDAGHHRHQGHPADTTPCFFGSAGAVFSMPRLLQFHSTARGSMPIVSSGPDHKIARISRKPTPASAAGVHFTEAGTSYGKLPIAGQNDGSRPHLVRRSSFRLLVGTNASHAH